VEIVFGLSKPIEMLTEFYRKLSADVGSSAILLVPGLTPTGSELISQSSTP
jgi:hypothetical protein